MWSLVPTLILLGLTLLAVSPVVQQNGSSDSLINQTFPNTQTTQLSEDDLGMLIQNLYTTDNATTQKGPILDTQNRQSSNSTDCECVLYFLCKDGRILDNGMNLIDIRFGSNDEIWTSDDEEYSSGGTPGPCENYLELCCKPPDIQQQQTSPPTERTRCGQRHSEGVGFRLTGHTNNETRFGELPWMVAILKEYWLNPITRISDVYQCGGALIHRQAVLTAAHCVNGKWPSELKVRVGEWDTQTKNEIYPHQDRDVETIVVHENFHSGTLYNDYALLILKTPLDYAENVDIVCLPGPNDIFSETKCLASGWGKDVFGKEGRYQMILKKVEIPIVPHATCQNIMRTTRLGKYFVLDKSFICAGGEVGKDTCKGDGGSPLVCPLKDNPSRYVQAGIVAWGIGCGEDGTPGVYANIAHARRWIDEQMAYYNLDNTVYQYH